MASWSDAIYQDNDTLKTNLIDHSYSDAITTFLNNGIQPFTYRELKWDGSDIVRNSDSLSSSIFTLAQKLKYFPQLVQLVDIGSKSAIYP